MQRFFDDELGFIKNPLSSKEKRIRAFLVGVCGLFIVAIGFVEQLTAFQLGLSFFYAIPILLAVEMAGARTGVFFSFLSSVSWFISDRFSNQHYDHFLLPYWNALVQFCFFMMVVMIFSQWRKEKASARMDSLTGVGNRQAFYEWTELEIARSKRYKHAFCVAYIDCDDFKKVNDLYGHGTGDRFLCTMANTITDCLRSTDRVARLGGDEFGILMCETGSESAHIPMERIRSQFEKSLKSVWPVTLSVGVVAFENVPGSTREAIDLADDLMYSVKQHGKDQMRIESYHGPSLHTIAVS